MPRYMKPEDVRLDTDDQKPYTDLENKTEFEHESFQLERPAHVPKLSEGTHDAEILKMHRTREPSFDDPSVMEDKIVVLFSTSEGTIQRTMNEKYHEKSVLGQLLTAALGEIPASISSDDLVGKKLRITIIHKEKGADVWENVSAFKKPRS